jgi:hypothetical protein
MNSVLIVCLLTAVIHMIETLAYGARIAGIITKRLYLASSLFSIVALVARTANLIQAPLLGYYVDSMIFTGNIPLLRAAFRLIIFSATVGSIFAVLLLPTFITTFTYLIASLERAGSLGKMILTMFRADHLLKRASRRLRKSLRSPRISRIFIIREKNIPAQILFLYILVASIYTVGVLSAIYAGALVPDFRLTASQMSGILNGFSTIVLTFFIDPYASLVTDHAMVGRKKISDLNTLIIYLITGKIIGTVLGQLAFLPCARFVVLITTLLQQNVVI